MLGLRGDRFLYNLRRVGLRNLITARLERSSMDWMDVCSRVFHKGPEAGIRRLALESSKLRRSLWTDAEQSGSYSGEANPPNQNAWLKSVLLYCRDAF